MKTIKEVFYELIDEAKDGQVILDDEPFNISFNTVIENDKAFFNEETKESLMIEDMDLFLIKLSEYVDLELDAKRRMMPIAKDVEDNTVKTLIANLFVNASYKDFADPVSYIERRIDFLKDKTFSNYDNGVIIPLGEELLNSNLHIINEVDSIHSETPNKMSFYLEKDGDKYYLPSINYGISGDTCYIYSMKNKNEGKNKDSKFAIDMNELLYGLDGDEETVNDEYVFTSSMFFNMLNEKGINNVEIISVLPVRHDTRNLTDSTFDDVISRISGVNVTAKPLEQDENTHMKVEGNILISNESIDNKVR